MIAFLDAYPAARATNRRRLSAIRWIHQHASTFVPHRTTGLRSRVLPPTDRTIDAATIRPILQEMPTSGWTAGLVGRRDALLLVLTAHGVPYTAIERLHRRDVAVDGNRCLVIMLANSVVRIPAAPHDSRMCPVAVYLVGRDCSPTTTGIPRRFVPVSVPELDATSGFRDGLRDAVTWANRLIHVVPDPTDSEIHGSRCLTNKTRSGLSQRENPAGRRFEPVAKSGHEDVAESSRLRPSAGFGRPPSG